MRFEGVDWNFVAKVLCKQLVTSMGKSHAIRCNCRHELMDWKSSLFDSNYFEEFRYYLRTS